MSSKDTTQMSDEDEQLYTMQKITDMLIAAGYFRARISGLDHFDKVVGGWYQFYLNIFFKS